MPRAPVPLTVRALSELVGGRVVGREDIVLSAVGPLEGAGGDTLSLLRSSRYLPEFRVSAAGSAAVGSAVGSAK